MGFINTYKNRIPVNTTPIAYDNFGNLILIEGSVQINKWQDRNGVNRENAEVLVNRVVFLETKGNTSNVKDDVIEENNEPSENFFEEDLMKLFDSDLDG